IFNHSYGQVASMFPEGGGYSSFLHGRVVDMFYFPVIQGTYPDWIPFKGGDYFIFFRPVFNIADSSITIGIFSILIFYRGYFGDSDHAKENEESDTESEEYRAENKPQDNS
ncbi:MAG: signal peptidase II, partial [Prolixibacteraceae bacterium]